MRRVLLLAAVLCTTAAAVPATLSAQAAARWLDRPLAGWNQGATAMPASPITAESHAALDRRCGSATFATSTSAGAVRRAGWVPFLHLDRALERNDIEVIGGMSGATPGCEPVLYNLFVFVGGRFAGTVSPDTMTPSRDGAAGAVRITGAEALAEALTVEFARYTPGDPECCPSSRVRVSYRIDKGGAGATLVATDARQIR